MSIEVRDLAKRFGDFEALRGVSLADEARRAGGAARAVRLRQDHAAADHRRARVPGPGRRALRGRGRHRAQRARPARGLRVPALRPVPAHERVRERGLRPAREAARRRGRASRSCARACSSCSRLVQLEGLAGRLPSELSGGQRQRVALARALAVEPRVLLLDEPFGALDSRVRKELRRWLRRLHDELGLTSVFVTHDQEEALELADRVVVMNHGRIEQVGTPEEIYHEPANAFVYEFLGDVNVFHARVEGEPARVYVRPAPARGRAAAGGDDASGELRARVERIHAAGPSVKLELVTDAGDRGAGGADPGALPRARPREGHRRLREAQAEARLRRTTSRSDPGPGSQRRRRYPAEDPSGGTVPSRAVRRWSAASLALVAVLALAGAAAWSQRLALAHWWTLRQLAQSGIAPASVEVARSLRCQPARAARAARGRGGSARDRRDRRRLHAGAALARSRGRAARRGRAADGRDRRARAALRRARRPRAEADRRHRPRRTPASGCPRCPRTSS